MSRHQCIVQGACVPPVSPSTDPHGEVHIPIFLPPASSPPLPSPPKTKPSFHWPVVIIAAGELGIPFLAATASPSPAPSVAQPEPSAHRPVAAIAAGSAAAAVFLLSVIFCLVATLIRWRRSANRRKAATQTQSSMAAATVGPISISPPGKPALDVSSPTSAAPAAQETAPYVDLSPPSTLSDAPVSLSAASGESFNRHQSHHHHGYRHTHPFDEHGNQPMPPAPSDDIFFRGSITYGELATATNGFAECNIIGRGGFGDVYVGTMDSTAVAVKRLRVGSQQGDREFQAEVRIIGRVHHRNLVSLVGYCVADNGQRLLVYEFVPNMTLEHHLHGEVQTILDWPTRWKIAVGAAKGLAYLHEDCHPRIIHRDIKSSNILLDFDFNPKVSDFGMAKFIPGGDTHVSTRIVGTIGYLAPEYAISGRFTEKSDVFSFGVVLLELITGMSAAISLHPDADDTLVGWARPLLTLCLELGNYQELVDPLLASFDADRMARLIRCAAAAVRSTAQRRPRMSQIVRYLEGDTSVEDIDTCGDVRSSGPRISAHRVTTVQFGPVRYNDIRMSRKEAGVSKAN